MQFDYRRVVIYYEFFKKAIVTDFAIIASLDKFRWTDYIPTNHTVHLVNSNQIKDYKVEILADSILHWAPNDIRVFTLNSVSSETK